MGNGPRGGSETPHSVPMPRACEETAMSVPGGGDSPSLCLCSEVTGMWGLPGGAKSGGPF